MPETTPKPDRWLKYARLFFIGIILFIAAHYLAILDHGAQTKAESTPNPVETTQPARSNPWTPEIEHQIKERMMVRQDLQQLKIKPRSYFCDCFIKQMEVAYPNGAAGADTATLHKWENNCLDSIITHQKDLE